VQKELPQAQVIQEEEEGLKATGELSMMSDSFVSCNNQSLMNTQSELMMSCS
jgi:hypothetical protein